MFLDYLFSTGLYGFHSNSVHSKVHTLYSFIVENQGISLLFSTVLSLDVSFPSRGFFTTQIFNGFSIEGAGPGVGGTSLSGASLHTSGISCRVTEVSLLFFSLHRPLGAEGVLGALGASALSGSSCLVIHPQFGSQNLLLPYPLGWPHPLQPWGCLVQGAAGLL